MIFIQHFVFSNFEDKADNFEIYVVLKFSKYRTEN